MSGCYSCRPTADSRESPAVGSPQPCGGTSAASPSAQLRTGSRPGVVIPSDATDAHRRSGQPVPAVAEWLLAPAARGAAADHLHRSASTNMEATWVRADANAGIAARKQPITASAPIPERLQVHPPARHAVARPHVVILAGTSRHPAPHVVWHAPGVSHLSSKCPDFTRTPTGRTGRSVPRTGFSRGTQ